MVYRSRITNLKGGYLSKLFGSLLSGSVHDIGILITEERKDYNESFTPELEAEYFYDYQYSLKKISDFNSKFRIRLE